MGANESPKLVKSGGDPTGGAEAADNGQDPSKLTKPNLRRNELKRRLNLTNGLHRNPIKHRANQRRHRRSPPLRPVNNPGRKNRIRATSTSLSGIAPSQIGKETE